jgi:tRNA-(ms[2]io[6]A)-hydroxylase
MAPVLEAMARVKWLLAPTSPGWVRQAIARPDLLLIDHAHCERKAAGVALQLMFRYPSDGELGERLSPLAREELAHFERVLVLMRRRHIAPRALQAPAYGAALKAQARRQEPARLLDSLLISGLIEARSHERMALLAVHSPDQELRELYGDLLASEARHFGLYWLLCEARFGREATVERLEQLARAEWEALVPGDLGDGEGDRVRMHSPGVLPIGSDPVLSRGEGSDGRWDPP